MNRITILIFALAITSTLGVDTCTNTDVSTHFNQVANSGSLQTALGSSLASCKSLETKATCCTDNYFSTFSGDKDTLQTTLGTAAGTRDQAILDARKAVADQYANYLLFKAAATAASSTLTSWASAVPNGASFSTSDVQSISTTISTIETAWDDFFTNYATYYTGFNTYQSDRATCFTEVLKTVVSTWCLACLTDQQLPDYGVTLDANSPPAFSAFAFGTTVKGRLAAACQPYFADSETQGKILIASQYAAGIEAMTTALTQIAAETQSGVTDFLAVTKTTLTQQPSTIDNACTTTTCDWIETNVFVDGVLQNDVLIRGGDVATTRRRRLQKRMLQGGSFEPATDEAVMTISFPSNPGSVTNTNDLSALRVGVFSCIVAFFVALLI